MLFVKKKYLLIAVYVLLGIAIVTLIVMGASGQLLQSSLLGNDNQDKELSLVSMYGASNLFPADSQEAFIKGADLGAIGVYSGLVETADNQIVVSSTPYVNHKICVGEERIELEEETSQDLLFTEMTYDEVQKYDCESLFYKSLTRLFNEPEGVLGPNPPAPEIKQHDVIIDSRIKFGADDVYSKRLLSDVVSNLDTATQNGNLPPQDYYFRIESTYTNSDVSSYIDTILGQIDSLGIADRTTLVTGSSDIYNELYTKSTSPKVGLLVDEMSITSIKETLAEEQNLIFASSLKFYTNPKLLQYVYESGVEVGAFGDYSIEQNEELLAAGVRLLITPHPDLDLYEKGLEYKDATVKTDNYTFLFPERFTPWAYQNKQIGGVRFLDYESERDFERLKEDFKKAIAVHKPDMIMPHVRWRELQPPAHWTPMMKDGEKIGGMRIEDDAFPEGTNTIEDIVGTELDVDYFQDLATLAAEHDIEVVFYMNAEAYGGTRAYPFTYVGRMGWFWKRPDWEHGLVDPLTDAMRYPSPEQNGKSYDWLEHRVGYVNPQKGTSHHVLTTDGQEFTRTRNRLTGEKVYWDVYEDPTIVYNGSDTDLDGGIDQIHSPIPSYSSETYRDVSRQLYKNFAQAMSSKNNVVGYSLWLEPSYAHLRENVNYGNNLDGDPNTDTCIRGADGKRTFDAQGRERCAGKSDAYDVDYSPVELARYNVWRQQKGLPEVTQVPYPVDDTYAEFREYNLADFLKNLKQGIQEADSSAEVSMALFEDRTIKGLGADSETSIEVIEPEIIGFEPPHRVREVYHDESELAEWLEFFSAAQPATKLLSHYPASTKIEEYILSSLKPSGYTTFWGPAVLDFQRDPQGYATWKWPECDTCVFRYRHPNGQKLTLPDVHDLTPSPDLKGEFCL